MRGIVQFEVDDGQVWALDVDGVLWRGVVLVPAAHLGGAYRCDWTAVEGPPDDEPFLDHRDKLDRFEEKIRGIERERKAVFGTAESRDDSEGSRGEAEHKPGDDQPHGDRLLDGE